MSNQQLPRIEELIVSQVLKGKGDDADPYRNVLQLFQKDGTFVAENDPLNKTKLDLSTLKQEIADTLRFGSSDYNCQETILENLKHLCAIARRGIVIEQHLGKGGIKILTTCGEELVRFTQYIQKATKHKPYVNDYDHLS